MEGARSGFTAAFVVPEEPSSALLLRAAEGLPPEQKEDLPEGLRRPDLQGDRVGLRRVDKHGRQPVPLWDRKAPRGRGREIVKDDRAEATGYGAPDIEAELGRLTTVPVPPGLHQRVMDRACESRRYALLSPGMRIAAVTCSVLIVALLAAEPLLGRHEAARLASLVDVRVRPGPAGEPSAVLAEVLGGIGEAAEAAQMARREIIAAASARREQERQFTEARKWLKGWLAHEAFEDLI